MKSVLTISITLLLIVGAQAQKISIAKAKTLWEQGDLAEAKTMIDDATTYEKTMNDGKTWFYRGLIYSSIDTSSNEAIKGLASNAREVVLSSFAKANDLDDGKGYALFTGGGLITIDTQIGFYYGYYFNKAIETYEVDDFESASEFFEIAGEIVPADTASIGNAGYAAQAAEDYDRAISLFEENLKRGANSLAMFNNLISLYRSQENIEKALETIGVAKELYPSDNGLNRIEISILINQNRAQEAMDKLKSAILLEPNDHILHFALGLLYEELTQVDSAIIAYDRAIAIKQDHYESSFNKAAILFNRANVLYKEKGLLGYSAADQKKAKEMDPKIKEGFSKAIPAWESVYAINPKDRAALETLIFLYAYMGEEKKADKVEAELIALGDEDGN